MKVLSVNVGLPKKVLFNGQNVTTGIFKDPVKGPIMLRKLNLDGDKQADLTVHGGVDKAVYTPLWSADLLNFVCVKPISGIDRVRLAP